MGHRQTPVHDHVKHTVSPARITPAAVVSECQTQVARGTRSDKSSLLQRGFLPILAQLNLVLPPQSRRLLGLTWRHTRHCAYKEQVPDAESASTETTRTRATPLGSSKPGAVMSTSSRNPSLSGG
jgi:hypothetical protein